MNRPPLIVGRYIVDCIVLYLQTMISICIEELQNLDMTLNVKKSQVMRIDPYCCRPTGCKMISVNGGLIKYVEKLKYLGCALVSAKSFKVSLPELSIKFYKSFNSFYSKGFKCNESAMLFHLINAHYKPFLLYRMESA